MTDKPDKEKDKNDENSPVVIASSRSRFCDKEIPAWLSYVVTFIAFPLNVILLCQAVFIYGLFYSQNWTLQTIFLLYAGFIAVDRNRCDGFDYPCHRFPFNKLRSWVRNNYLYAMCTAYHPVYLHKTAELPATDEKGNPCQYFFTCHPHGVISVGTWSIFVSDEVGFDKLFPGINPYVAGIKHAFFVPFFRDWCILAGCVSASKAGLHRILGERKKSVAINLGGAAEAFITMDENPDTGNPKLKLLIKDRKGFCKVALQNGVPLVPVLSLQEQLLYDVIKLPSFLHKLQIFLQKHVYGVAPVLAWGNKWPFMPKRQQIDVFVGKPIPCKRVENPTQKDIDEKHKEYCQELEAMFHRCKTTVKGCENWELELVEHPVKQLRKE